MNAEEEMKIWEAEHQALIIGWQAEWDKKPSVKIVTFDFKDVDDKKKSKVFEIPVKI